MHIPILPHQLHEAESRRRCEYAALDKISAGLAMFQAGCEEAYQLGCLSQSGYLTNTEIDKHSGILNHYLANDIIAEFWYGAVCARIRLNPGMF